MEEQKQNNVQDPEKGYSTVVSMAIISAILVAVMILAWWLTKWML